MINVLYQSDNNYAPFMGVSIYSLLKNNSKADDICVYIIDDGISEKNRGVIVKDIEGFGRRCVFLDAAEILNDPRLKDYPKYGGGRKNVHSFLKLFLNTVLPSDVERIIYIDCDTLVLDDITELMEYDLQGGILGMVQDSLFVNQRSMIGFSDDDRYYNSGVMLIDMNVWREKDCDGRVLRHSLEHTYGTVDQDMINVEFKDEIVRVPIRYNYQPHHLVYPNKVYFKYFTHKQGTYYENKEIDEARNNIAIMHFFRYVGEQPWHKGNVHPCTKLFDQYMEESGFAGYVKKPSGRGAVFKVEKFLYKILPHSCFLCLFNIFFTVKLKRDASKGETKNACAGVSKTARGQNDVLQNAGQTTGQKMVSDLNVLYAFDNNYAPYAGVSILSLLTNNKEFDRICIYAVMDNVSEDNRARLERTVSEYSRELVTIDSTELNQLLKELGVPKYRGSYSTHYRKFFHMFLPETVDKILYVDSDTIITGSLMELVNKDFEGKCAMAALDTLGGRYKRLLGYVDREHYYNAGVSFFDVKAWRERDYGRKLVDHIINVRAKYCNPDQDLFNLVARGDVLTIGPEYNFQPVHRVYPDKTYFKIYPKAGYYSEEEIANARKKPVILHSYRYMGEFPWHDGNVHPDTPLFDEYLSRSEWSDYVKKPSGKGFIFKVEKWMYKHMNKTAFLFVFSIILYISFFRENIKLIKESKKYLRTKKV